MLPWFCAQMSRPLGEREADVVQSRLRELAVVAGSRGDAAEQAADAIDDQPVARGELRRRVRRNHGVAELRSVGRGEPRDPVVGAGRREDGEHLGGESDRDRDPSHERLAQLVSGDGVHDAKRVVEAHRRPAGLDDRGGDVRDAPGRRGELERRPCSGELIDVRAGHEADSTVGDLLLAHAMREARVRVDVLDVVPRVGERPARARDALEPVARSVARVGEPSQLLARARRSRRS